MLMLDLMVIISVFGGIFLYDLYRKYREEQQYKKIYESAIFLMKIYCYYMVSKGAMDLNQIKIFLENNPVFNANNNNNFDLFGGNFCPGIFKDNKKDGELKCPGGNLYCNIFDNKKKDDDKLDIAI